MQNIHDLRHQTEIQFPSRWHRELPINFSHASLLFFCERFSSMKMLIWLRDPSFLKRMNMIDYFSVSCHFLWELYGQNPRWTWRFGCYRIIMWFPIKWEMPEPLPMLDVLGGSYQRNSSTSPIRSPTDISRQTVTQQRNLLFIWMMMNWKKFCQWLSEYGFHSQKKIRPNCAFSHLFSPRAHQVFNWHARVNFSFVSFCMEK